MHVSAGNETAHSKGCSTGTALFVQGSVDGSSCRRGPPTPVRFRRASTICATSTDTEYNVHGLFDVQDYIGCPKTMDNSVSIDMLYHVLPNLELHLSNNIMVFINRH